MPGIAPIVHICHLGKLRQIQVGEHAADSLLSYLSEVSVGLGDWIIDIYLVQQELGGVSPVSTRPSERVMLPLIFTSSCRNTGSTISTPSSWVPLPPRCALPNGTHAFSTTRGVGINGQISYIERHIQRTPLLENTLFITRRITSTIWNIFTIRTEITNIDFAVVSSHHAHGTNQATG